MNAGDGPYHASVPLDEQRTARQDVSSSLTVGASIAAWSIGAFVFYLIAGRALGPEQYGLAAALQSAIIVVAVPIIALQWSSARVIASGGSEGRAAAMATYRRGLVRGTAVVLALAIVATGVVIAITASGRDIPLAALCITFVAIVLHVPLLTAEGALQGSHRYVGLAWSYAASGVLRVPLILLLLLAPIGDVNATVLAVAIAVGIGAAWAVGLTWPDIRGVGAPRREDWRQFTSPLPAIVVGLGGIAILQNVDVIAAKLSIGGADAGLFGAAAVLAKGLLVVPQALTIVLLPRVAEQEARGRPTGSFLAVGVLAMAITGVAAMAVAAVVEGPVMTIAFGPEYEPAASLLVPFIGATTLLGALLILVNHHVARSDHRFVWVVGALAIVQIGLLAAFSDSMNVIITIDAAVAAVGLVAHEIIYAGTDESMITGATAQARSLMHRIRKSSEGTS